MDFVELDVFSKDSRGSEGSELLETTDCLLPESAVRSQDVHGIYFTRLTLLLTLSYCFSHMLPRLCTGSYGYYYFDRL